MKKIHKIDKIQFSGSQMKIKIDGEFCSINLTKTSKRLLKASKKEREAYEISPAGYGIHWPMIDEDLSITSFLKTTHKLPSKTLSKK